MPPAALLQPSPDVHALVGWLQIEPLVYEDFLPVSAAGIFQSNLGDGGLRVREAGADQPVFEAALGARVLDAFALYEAESQASLHDALAQWNTPTSFVNASYSNAPGSAIRELKRFADLPDMISLAGGYPAAPAPCASTRRRPLR